MSKLAAVLGLVLILVSGAAVRAEDKPEAALPARVATHHAITLGGRRFDYDAIVETFALTDRKGKPTATI
ncbi:MAG TPA: hypothetical protein VGR45_07265, partial [Stellaceae bacterium]|nr:hypothetical protein [Stellaceae bacterium]